jgi:ferrochelatase
MDAEASSRTVERPARPERAATAAPRGVLLMNVGSPDAPTAAALRRYLDEFLSDPFVVDANRILWWFVRKLIVLPFRSPVSAQLYRNVWTEAGSPLLVHSRAQRDGLTQVLGDTYRVALGMRCGSPSIEDGLRELTSAGCREVVLVPMFPQYSGTTVGTCVHEAQRVVKTLDPRPRLELTEPFFVDEGYVASVASGIRAAGLDGMDHVVLSFHGLPERYVERGDPYRDQCEKTAAAIVAELGLEAGSWSLAFQSRFGRARWLEPDVAALVPALAPGCRRVLVACPGFTADCLETLEEIGMRLRDGFLEAGGDELRVVPCLNADAAWIDALAAIVRTRFERAG